MPLSHVFIPVTYTKTCTSENFSRTVFPKTAEVNYSLEEYLDGGSSHRLGTIQRLAQKTMVELPQG